MKFKRYNREIVRAHGRGGAGFRLNIQFRSAEGYAAVLKSQILLAKDIKSKFIISDIKRNGTKIYTQKFWAEMERHASRIAGITELGK